ncbi:MAG: flippase [Nitrososphaerota archaeon]|jgi:O-antigen/teichoic acid export membrane protein|nr:flippase [Nitrososphaerota archaeon]
MGATEDLAKTSTKAGFNFFWGLVLSTVISSAGTIYISKFLGESGYALYGIALTVPNILFIFRDWGIGTAITRYTAKYRAENRKAEIKSIFLSGLLFELIMGVALSIVAFLLSDYLANDYFQRPVATLIKIASLTILTGGIVNAATAIFTGIEETTYNSIMIIFQSITKTLLTIGLVITSFGVTGAIAGITAGYIIACIVGLIFIIIVYRKLPKTPNYTINIKKYLKIMLKYCAPLSIAGMLTALLAQFYTFFLARVYIDDVLIGNYAAAQNFVVLIGFFALPITSVLLPAFSKLDIKKDKTELQNIYQAAIKYSTLIIIPVVMIVLSLSTQAITTLYQDSYTLTPIFLTILSISYLLTAVGNLNFTNILNSQKQTKLNLKLSIITTIIGFSLGYILITYYNVYGLVITSLIAPIPSVIISIIWLKKHYELTTNWLFSAKILITATITAIPTYLFINSLHLNNFTLLQNTINQVNILNTISNYITIGSAIELTIGTIFYIITFIGLITITKTLTKRDIHNLRQMTTNLGPVTKIIHLALNTIEKTMTKLKTNKQLTNT